MDPNAVMRYETHIRLIKSLFRAQERGLPIVDKVRGLPVCIVGHACSFGMLEVYVDTDNPVDSSYTVSATSLCALSPLEALAREAP